MRILVTKLETGVKDASYLIDRTGTEPCRALTTEPPDTTRLSRIHLPFRPACEVFVLLLLMYLFAPHIPPHPLPATSPRTAPLTSLAPLPRTIAACYTTFK